MAPQWKKNKQLDHCGHHGISCLSRSDVFVEKNQKGVTFCNVNGETFCKWGDFLLCGGVCVRESTEVVGGRECER